MFIRDAVGRIARAFVPGQGYERHKLLTRIGQRQDPGEQVTAQRRICVAGQFRRGRQDLWSIVDHR
jgi:hypothetical protein